MLASLTPEEWAEIEAAYETVPLDDGWRQADTIAGALQDQMAIHFAMKAGKRRVDKSSQHKRGGYIPKLRIKKRGSISVNQASIDLAQRMIESQHAV